MRPVFYQRRWEPNLGLSRHTIYRILFWLVVAFVAYRVFLFGKGIFDSHRATSLARQAEVELAEGRDSEAMSNLKLALSYDERNPAAARVMARVLDAEDNLLAVEYHRLVVESREAGAEDFRRMALSAARHGDQDLALEAAAKNRELGGDPAFPDLIQAGILSSKGDSAGGEKALRAALEQRESSETLVALADFLLADSELLDLNAAEASRLLFRAGQIDKGPAGLQALRRGLTSGILAPGDRSAWVEMYLAHPAADTTSRLDAVEMELAANPSSRAEILQKRMPGFRVLPVAEKAKVARWLLNKGEPRAALEILPYSQASTAADPFRIWIAGAIAFGDWGAIETGLQKPLPTLEDSARLPLLAQAIKQQGRVDEADAVYAQSLRQFQSDPVKLAEFLAGLLAAGEWDLFENNLAPVILDPRVAPGALRLWVPLARDHRSSTRLLGFYEKALSSPALAQDSYLLDRIQFCRLILGVPVPVEDIELHLKQSGDTPGALATAALGYLRNGRKARALYILESGENPLEVSRLTPSRQAAVAAVFAANDRVAEARQIAERIPRQKLTVEEEAFLEKALARGGMPD